MTAAQITRTVRYRGPAPFAGLLAQRLEEEGVEVEYEPPIEKRDAQQVVEAVIVIYTCKGIDAAIKYGVQRFRESRLGRNTEVEIEDDDEGESPVSS